MITRKRFLAFLALCYLGIGADTLLARPEGDAIVVTLEKRGKASFDFPDWSNGSEPLSFVHVGREPAYWLKLAKSSTEIVGHIVIIASRDNAQLIVNSNLISPQTLIFTLDEFKTVTIDLGAGHAVERIKLKPKAGAELGE